MALGVNFWNGLLASLPSLAMALPAPPDLTWRSLATRSVWPLATRVPSKVSVKLSWMSRAFESTIVKVLLSLRTSRTVLSAASGPLVKTSIATCGRYVKRNMPVVTHSPSVRVGASFENSGL